MPHPLADPRAKIRRAKHHLDEFDGEGKKWVDSNPYVVLPYPNADKTFWKFMVHRLDEPIKPESDTFGLIIGDYVHNLRSALDQLVWQLVTVANGITPKSDGEVAFPVVTSHPREFWNRSFIQRGELTFEQALFLEGFQPYRSIDTPNPLADLHALWIADKHKLVTAVKVTLMKQGPIFKVSDADIIEAKWDSEIALEGDAEIAWVTIRPTGPNPRVDVEYLPAQVAFGESGRLTQSLPNLLTITEEIVENCARFFA